MRVIHHVVVLCLVYYASSLSLGNYVWCDANGNGMQDTTEQGVSHVLVELTDPRNHVLDQTLTDFNGHYSFNVQPNSAYIVRIDFLDHSAVLKFPTRPNQGFDPEKNSKGQHVSIEGRDYSAFSLFTKTSDITHVDFGFLCVDCTIDTPLYDAKSWSDSVNSAGADPVDEDLLMWLNSNDDVDEELLLDSFSYDPNQCNGHPLQLSVTNRAGSVCVTFNTEYGVCLNQLRYFALSGNSIPIDASTIITSASHLGGDITNMVSIETYSSEFGYNPCSLRPGCDPLPATASPSVAALSQGDIVVCLACNMTQKLATPVEVCFADLTAYDLEGLAVKASTEGYENYCGAEQLDLYGLIPNKCKEDTHPECECEGLKGDISCNVPCDGKELFQLITSQPQDNVVCFNFNPTEDVTVGSLDFITFVDSYLYEGLSIFQVIDGNGRDITNETSFEVYQSGNVCGSVTGCKPYKVGYGMHKDALPGETNFCFFCNHTTPVTNNISDLDGWLDSDDSDDDNDTDDEENENWVKPETTTLPLKICYQKPDLTELFFNNAVIKVRLSGVEGYCKTKSVQAAITMRTCFPNLDPQITLYSDTNGNSQRYF